MLFIAVALLSQTFFVFARPYYSADLNEDEFVDFIDFAKFAANWQQSGENIDGDFDNSGLVDVNDLQHFTQYWLEDVIYPPIVEDQNVILTQGHSAGIVLQANDENNDVLDYFVISYPAHGALVLDGNMAGYNPFAAYDGNDSFIFLAYDGKYESDIATVSITVRPDTDGDGLSDYDEINAVFGYITDPCNPNSDSDIMPDGWEVENSLNPTVDDGSGDADGDGLCNADEYTYGTNPYVQDTDGDGLQDGIEVSPANGYVTNPTNPDTDGDGVKDGDELSWNLNPLDTDTDDDDLNDGAEVAFNGSQDYNPVPPGYYQGDFRNYDTDANDSDSDTDGMTDGWEAQYTQPDSEYLDPRYKGISSWLDAEKDIDTDGLKNIEEYLGQYGSYQFACSTNPRNWDTDGDGECDGDEAGADFWTPYTYRSDPTLIDTDSDGLVDGWHGVVSAQSYPEGVVVGGYVVGERNYSTNTLDDDTDNDSMGDGWEVRYSNGTFNPTVNYWRNDDFDSDGLKNYEDSQQDTDPWNCDHDGDGLDDGCEVNVSGTEPKNADTDGDNLVDGLEINSYQTNPLDFDSDDDLLPDGWEVQYSLDPSSSIDNNGKNGDPDGDNLINFDELVYGTNPQQGDSDSDGTNDGAEVAQGSNPADGSDGGQTPAEDKYLNVKLTVGDHSGSHSERYNLKVGSITHQAPEFGVVEERGYPFEVGKKYEIRIIHTGSNISPPDYDYTALIEPNETLDGVGIVIDDPEGILGIHSESTYFYARGKTAYLYVVKSSLKIYNGGNNGIAGSEFPDANEMDLGSYLLVNWDDDDEDDKPDLYKSGTVSGDDDLAKIELSLLPAELNKGTLEFVKAGGTGCNVKIWDSADKQNEITDLSWDIASQTPPSQLWLEATAASNSERDISLELRYTNNGTTIADTVKATAVMVNLGNAVYRDNEVGWGVDPERGHAAIVYKYTGACAQDAFDSADNFGIIAMKGPSGDKTLANITNSGDPCYGCYTNVSDITYAKRIAIIKTAKELAEREIEYEALNALIPHKWDGAINSITDLRCDGLVEVCYELNGINVWAMKRNYYGMSYNYDISDWIDILEYDNHVWQSGANNKNDNLEEHNDFDVGDENDWNDTLQPATQCGYVTPVDAKTKFSRQDLCQPIGHKGGN